MFYFETDGKYEIANDSFFLTTKYTRVTKKKNDQIYKPNNGFATKSYKTPSNEKVTEPLQMQGDSTTEMQLTLQPKIHTGQNKTKPLTA